MSRAHSGWRKKRGLRVEIRAPHFHKRSPSGFSRCQDTQGWQWKLSARKLPSSLARSHRIARLLTPSLLSLSLCFFSFCHLFSAARRSEDVVFKNMYRVPASSNTESIIQQSCSFSYRSSPTHSPSSEILSANG